MVSYSFQKHIIKDKWQQYHNSFLFSLTDDIQIVGYGISKTFFGIAIVTSLCSKHSTVGWRVRVPTSSNTDYLESKVPRYHNYFTDFWF